MCTVIVSFFIILIFCPFTLRLKSRANKKGASANFCLFKGLLIFPLNIDFETKSIQIGERFRRRIGDVRKDKIGLKISNIKFILNDFQLKNLNCKLIVKNHQNTMILCIFKAVGIMINNLNKNNFNTKIGCNFNIAEVPYALVSADLSLKLNVAVIIVSFLKILLSLKVDK